MLALNVVFQCLARHVAAVTELARERALVGVRVLVTSQLQRVHEALGADAALEGPAVGVSLLLVLQQVAFQREALVAQLAYMWFLAAMSQQVIL